jgi:hypothetical protein
MPDTLSKLVIQHIDRELIMDVKDYCRSIEVELYGWKVKMYAMIRKVDKLRSESRENMQSRVEDLHKYIDEMENMISQLQMECPIDFSSQKKRVEEKTSEMKEKYEDAMAAVLKF